MRNETQYWMLVIDHDEKVFNLVGPVVDDTEITNEVIREQSNGRAIGCQGIPTDRSQADIAQSYSKQSGYALSSSRILKHHPPVRAQNHGSLYSGKLPAYARGADRGRLVRVLCKGQCGMVRWAEMSVDFPGIDCLRNSQVGDFQATCLVCGRVARDSYNWLR